MSDLKAGLAAMYRHLAESVENQPDEPELLTIVHAASRRTRAVFKMCRTQSRLAEKVATEGRRPLISVGGNTFVRMTHVCKRFNISNSVAVNRFRSEYWPDWISEQFPKVIARRGNKTQAMPCRINGVEYESIATAARELDITVNQVFYKLYSDRYPEWTVVPTTEATE